MRILLLSRYGTRGASSRLRYLQYDAYFREHGVYLEPYPLLSNRYLEALYDGRRAMGDVVRGYFGRVSALFTSGAYDLVIVEKELFPFLPATIERILRLLKIPYIVDFDDAVFHRYDQHRNIWVRRFLNKKIDVVMRCASKVITGNAYLAERARSAGAADIEIIPTVVDSDRYHPSVGPSDGRPIVGWIGTPETSHFLLPLMPLFEALQRRMEVRFVAVGARHDDFSGTPVEVWSWSEELEVASIQSFDIGIMPLPDTPWAQGKCGYKLIQYMACGLPVVASPVGVNAEIVQQNHNGFHAAGLGDWESALTDLLADGERRWAMGQEGRARVESWFCLNVQAPRVLAAIKGTAE